MNFSESHSSARSTSRARRKQQLRLLVQKAKKKLKFRRHVRRSALPSEEQRITSFCRWCAQIGIELHPKIQIGRLGSCAEIGVVASEDIAKGECLAVIPRGALLTSTNSRVAALVSNDKKLTKSSTSSWVPLLIALAAETSKKESSLWRDYLALVPNNEECSPPMMWAESERNRLLEGTGLLQRVEQDLTNIEHDFTDMVLPFMLKYPQHFSPSMQSLPAYLRLVSMVMSYSFTDGAASCSLSRTMMVPFVDLLNHHSRHHVELEFTKTSLHLMVVRDIKKGEEVMNTYGKLSNASLLHTYGFTQEDNPYDEALISASQLKRLFLTNSPPLEASSREERWKAVENDDMFDNDYSVSRSGRPSSQLLEVVRLLHMNKHRNSLLARKHRASKVKLSDLTSKERLFLKRLAEDGLNDFPESYEEVLTCSTFLTSMTRQEQQTLYLSRGQQNCLRELIRRLEGGAS